MLVQHESGSQNPVAGHSVGDALFCSQTNQSGFCSGNKLRIGSHLHDIQQSNAIRQRSDQLFRDSTRPTLCLGCFTLPFESRHATKVNTGPQGSSILLGMDWEGRSARNFSVREEMIAETRISRVTSRSHRMCGLVKSQNILLLEFGMDSHAPLSRQVPTGTGQDSLLRQPSGNSSKGTPKQGCKHGSLSRCPFDHGPGLWQCVFPDLFPLCQGHTMKRETT